MDPVKEEFIMETRIENKVDIYVAISFYTFENIATYFLDS